MARLFANPDAMRAIMAYTQAASGGQSAPPTELRAFAPSVVPSNNNPPHSAPLSSVQPAPPSLPSSSVTRTITIPASNKGKAKEVSELASNPTAADNFDRIVLRSGEAYFTKFAINLTTIPQAQTEDRSRRMPMGSAKQRLVEAERAKTSG
jgi:hypothetical protein